LIFCRDSGADPGYLSKACSGVRIATRHNTLQQGNTFNINGLYI
jgi:hypothetical protein